jgi:ribonucleoside-diphosphate reductase alpha chain
MNVSLYDEWKDTQVPFIATVFLDCVVSEFLEQAQGIPELDKIIRFTEKSRALGLGICGLHTLFQKHRLAFESMEAYLLSQKIVKQIRQQAEQATRWMASEWGEPEWCKGFNRRNTHLLAIAPTKSTALIMGGISEGINPDPAMVYTQQTPAGEVQRINPVLLGIMKERDRYNQKTINRILENFGSVQQEEWLSDKEKAAFKNAFEIDQKAIIRMASARQTYIDQGQSLNLFFSAEESEEYISQVHKLAFKDPNILSLYYCYSRAGVLASKGECSVCQ